MPLTWDDKREAARIRVDQRDPLVEQMRVVANHYNGSWVIPIPGTENSLADPLGPWLLAETVDTAALRATSVLPSAQCVPVDPDKHQGVRSAEYAAIRRAAVLDGWRRANMPLVLGKAFRHLMAYASFAMVVDYDWRTQQPCLRLLDPLGVFPEERSDTDFTPQRSVAVVYERTGRELLAMFPRQAGPRVRSQEQAEAVYQVLEWHDEDGCELGVMGGQYRAPIWQGSVFTRQVIDAEWPLAFYPSRTGRCDVVVGGAVSLTKAMAKLAKFTGQVEIMARLTALVMRATERSVFPDMFIVGENGETPVLAGGEWHEGTTGKINLVSGAREIGQLRNTPDPTGMQFIDRMERNVRVSLGQPSILSGESGSNALRTGRAIDSMIGTSSDPRIAEMQRLMAVSLAEAGSLTLDMYRAYNPSKTYTVYSSGRSKRTRREFTPSTHVENTEVQVWYPFEGSDADAVTIRLGQLVGTEMLSRTTARELHPMVDDATDEQELITAEKIEEALVATILARAQDPAGGIPPTDLARIAQLIRQGVGPADAVMKAQEEAQARQAAQAPTVPEGMAAAPETMPGLGMPGEGQQMQPPAAPEQQVAEPLQRFKSLVQAGRVPYGGNAGALG